MVYVDDIVVTRDDLEGMMKCKVEKFEVEKKSFSGEV